MKKLLLSALILTVTAVSTSCGIYVPLGSPDESATEPEKMTATEEMTDIEEMTKIKETTSVIDAFEETDSNEPDYDFMTGEVSAEASMKIEQIKRSHEADIDGFIIVGGVLYDYEGISPKVEIPKGVKRIEAHAFWSNDVVEALYIPSSVKEIGAGAFWGCSNLKFVQAEEGLEGIASTAFWSCSGLENVNLPSSLTNFGDAVFWACGEVTVHAPKGSAAEKYAEQMELKCDDVYAEYEMIDRKNAILGSQYAYGDFTEFTIPDNITSIESSAFEYCEKLESIFIPANVQYIAPDAFNYCYGLQTATIDGCREIRSGAFEYCEALHTVYINEGTETIGYNAFGYCRKLKDVYLPASLKSIDKDAFAYTDPELTLHVPAGSYAEDYAISMNIPFDNATSY